MKGDVLRLVTQLSNGLADPVTIDRLYDEVVVDLGHDEWLTNATLVPVSAGSPNSTALPTTIIDVLGMLYDDEQIGELTLKEVQYLNPNWRDEPGTPNSYIFDGETHNSFRLYPYPLLNSQTSTFAHGAPLGEDFPAYNALVFHTEFRPAVLAQMEMAVALLVFQKEFERESDHRWDEGAQAAGQLGKIFLEMVRS